MSACILREAVGWTELRHVVVLRFDGDGAFPALDRLSTSPLYLREGQLRHSLFLDEHASVFADLYVASDAEGYLVLAEGPDAETLAAYVERHTGFRPSPAPDHELWGLNGPYAWEVAAAVLGPSVLGMPYMSLLEVDDVVCLRAGKTGEYGYDLLVPAARSLDLRAELERAGDLRGLAPAGLDVLDDAALENGFFSIRSLPRGAALTPLELQLQWRVGRGRAFVGADALETRRAEGPRGRVTWFTAAERVAPGTPVLHDGRRVGEVLYDRWSSVLGEALGLALVETALAHPHLDFTADGDARPVAIRTRTVPLLDNRSLHVSPHKHAYETRGSDDFPPVVTP